MDTCTIMLALAGDSGNTVEKYHVTPAEIAVLRVIHGDDAVTDIKKTGTVERSNKEELARLHAKYSRADEKGIPDPSSPVLMLFPGAAARVFHGLDELDIPDAFFKAEKRATPARSESKADETPKSLNDMTKGELIDFAEANDIEVNAKDKKDEILKTIKAATDAPEQPAPDAPAEPADEIGEMKDKELFG